MSHGNGEDLGDIKGNGRFWAMGLDVVSLWLS
jgi:hypothetical protein